MKWTLVSLNCPELKHYSSTQLNTHLTYSNMGPMDLVNFVLSLQRSNNFVCLPERVMCLSLYSGRHKDCKCTEGIRRFLAGIQSVSKLSERFRSYRPCVKITDRPLDLCWMDTLLHVYASKCIFRKNKSLED